MKALYVIKREYLENVRKKSFIIGTILAPTILLLLYSIPILSMFFVPNEQISIAVLDRSGRVADAFIESLSDTLDDGRPKYIAASVTPSGGDFEGEKTGLVEDIQRNNLDVLIEVPEEALETGKINYISKDVFNERVVDDISDKLNTIIIMQRFSVQGLDFDVVSKLTEHTRLEEMKITKSGVLQEEQLVGKYILVVVFVMILYMSLLSWGISVQRSIIEEKSSRVIEVMLSSVEPKDLFLGKIIGVGSLGLTQIGIWAIIMLAIGFSSPFAAAQFATFVNISPAEVFFFVLFFVLGYTLYSALFTIIGAVCSTEQDAQQLQSLVILPLVIPIMLVFLVIQNPNATLSAVLSLIPLFTPMLMLARIVISEPSSWQIALSIVLLIISIYGVIAFSARVFRVGILMYGKRPSLKEIFRWSRYA
jgi:ABC-2 type transport system permease protein